MLHQLCLRDLTRRMRKTFVENWWFSNCWSRTTGLCFRRVFRINWISALTNLGGVNFAQKTLELAHGEFKANNMMNRISPVRDNLDFMEDIKEWILDKFTMSLRLSSLKQLHLSWPMLNQIRVLKFCKWWLQIFKASCWKDCCDGNHSDESDRLVASTLESRMGKKQQSPKSRLVELSRLRICWIGLIRKIVKNSSKALKKKSSCVN